MSMNDIEAGLQQKIASLNLGMKVFFNQTEQDNQPTPFVVWQIIPGSNGVSDYFSGQSDFRFQIALLIVMDTDKGDAILQEVADKAVRGLHKQPFTALNAIGCQCWMIPNGRGTVRNDQAKHSYIIPQFAVFGTMTN